jgi:glycopeptide antibiotics resistance protein
MGFFLPTLLSYRTRRGILLRIFLMIVGAEAIQAFLRLGILDIDDVIYNFLGAVTGYGINFRFREYISIVP